MIFGTILKGLRIFPLFYRYWWIWLSLILILPGFINSVDTGWVEKDLRIPMKYIGNIVVSADEGMYDILEEADFEIGETKSLGDKLNVSWYLLMFLVKNLWKNIWMMFFSIYAWYRGIRFISNDSLRGKALLFSVIIVGVIQIFVGGFPYRGSYSLIKFIVEILRNL